MFNTFMKTVETYLERISINKNHTACVRTSSGGEKWLSTLAHLVAHIHLFDFTENQLKNIYKAGICRSMTTLKLNI